MSKANKMYVRFFTETIGKKLSFRANFTGFREVTKGKCNVSLSQFLFFSLKQVYGKEHILYDNYVILKIQHSLNIKELIKFLK